jgi:protein SCO1/2
VGIDQHLNEQAPLDTVFADEQGRRAPLRSLFRGKPVILSFVYYECPMLCNMQLNGLLRAMRAMPLEAGRDFDVITLSFDAREKPEQAAAKKRQYVDQYRRAHGDEGWHFLTGEKEAIGRLTGAAGFRYIFDEASGQWAHASGIMVLTPEGRFSRYFYGIEISARDLRLGLVEASRGKIGSPADKILLFCFHYDPATGKYGLLVMNVVRAGGAATVLGICLFWVLMSRQRRKPDHHVARIPTVS